MLVASNSIFIIIASFSQNQRITSNNSIGWIAVISTLKIEYEICVRQELNSSWGNGISHSKICWGWIN
jgi:hypothetical protein